LLLKSTVSCRSGIPAVIALYVLLLAGTYYSAFAWLVTMDWVREDYSSSCLIPLIVVYLIWEKRAVLANISPTPTRKGLLAIAAGLLMYWLGELSGEFFSLYISFWLVLTGLVWSHGGTAMLKALAFQLTFLLAMFPFPNFITTMMTLKLKLLSSRLGVAILQMYGLSAYREGNVIDLGFTRLQVVDACSGLRYFIPLIVLSILLSYYFKAAFWKKALLVLSSIPIAVFTNGLRIASVGILYQYLGPAAAEGFFHDFSGWFIFMSSLGLLLLEMWILKRVFSGSIRQETAAAEGPRSANRGPSPEALTGNAPAGSKLLPAQAIVAALLLAATILLSHGISFREKTPISKPLDRFPLQLSQWRGGRMTMEKEYLDSLKFDDYLMVDYKDPQGKMVSFYTAYYSSQTKGESIHSPETCLPGSGWLFEESGDVTFPLRNGAGSMRVNRAYMQKGGVRELTYYWFPQHGRIVTNLFQLKLYTFWNALTSRRTDGALVRVITPVYESERLADAEARLQGFTREITPVLATFLPQ
jgi:exosortase D (VPLPA-CTERM-specific)